MKINQPQKNKRKEKVTRITNDQSKIYDQVHELIMQAFHTCMVRDVVRDYRYKWSFNNKSYNTINSFSHTALENYAILQLCKLFDKKNSIFNVWYVVKHMPQKSLKSWVDIEVKKIKKDIDYFSALRGNFVGHRSEIGYFDPKEFEEKFKNLRGSEERIKSFLLFFLCQLKFEMHKKEIPKTMEWLSLELKGYAKFLQLEKKKVLKDYE